MNTTWNVTYQKDLSSETEIAFTLIENNYNIDKGILEGKHGG